MDVQVPAEKTWLIAFSLLVSASLSHASIGPQGSSICNS